MVQYNTRIQLKSDTKTRWETANNIGFRPLQGELIIYLPDEECPYSRLKIGDGSTTVGSLPFVDSEVIMFPNYEGFPISGLPNKLYIDLTTKKIYCYNQGTYEELSQFNFTINKTPINSIANWTAGNLPTVSITEHNLNFTRGILPQLGWTKYSVVTDITKEEEE